MSTKPHASCSHPIGRRAWAAATLAVLAVALLPGTAAHAKEIARVASPDGAIAVSVELVADGRVTYAVSRRGKPVLAPSALGFLLTNAPKLDRNFVEAAPPQS